MTLSVPPSPDPSPNANGALGGRVVPQGGAQSGPTAASGAPVLVPLEWMLEQGTPAACARALLALTPLTADGERAARALALAHLPAVRLALGQQRDGSWPGGMLAVPSDGSADPASLGTIPALRRLAAYGWPADAPPFAAAKRLLFRLLALDDDPAFLFDLRADSTTPALERRARQRLREAAAATLAQLGLEADPRLRGAVVRVVERTGAYLKSEPPLTDGPLPESAAPPSVDLLLALAYMPRFRSEHGQELQRLLAIVTRPGPGEPVRQLVGGRPMPQPQLVLGDPLAALTDPAGAQLADALFWLELFGRLGFLRRHAPWLALLDRLLAERDVAGRWMGATPPPTRDPAVWPAHPVDEGTDAASAAVEVTGRLAFVAQLAGRPLELF